MNFFTVLFVVAVGFQVILSQSIWGAPLTTCLPGAEVVYSPAIPSPAIIQSNSVAASLADTLSLLTVSSLLAEKLPLAGPAVIASIPSPPVCGCGPGPVCGPYGYIL